MPHARAAALPEPARSSGSGRSSLAEPSIIPIAASPFHPLAATPLTVAIDRRSAASPFFHLARCDGSYLEDQDHWWLSGVHRDVWLYRKPRVHLADVDARIALTAERAAASGFAASLQLRGYVKLPRDAAADGGATRDAPPTLPSRLAILAILTDADGREVARRFSAPIDPTATAARMAAAEAADVPMVPVAELLPAAAAGEAAGGAFADWHRAPLVWVGQEEATAACADVVALEIEAALPDDMQLWTAESPYLYTLAVALVDVSEAAADADTDESGAPVLTAEALGADGRYDAYEPAAALEWEQMRLGARTCVVEGKQLLINGVAVTLKGVNRHEHDESTGKYVTEESMWADALMMKRYNFNACRCSHYPNATRWYEICDEVGLYVMDEANIETHGLVSMPAPSNKLHLNASPEWRRALLARVTRMVECQKNHACIFMWSLGNESGVGPTHLLMRQWVNARDPTRPTHYEGLGNCHNGGSEVISPMYAHPDHCVQLVDAAGNDDRPLLLCEYSHAMGNSNGGLADYWRLFREHPHVQVIAIACH